MNLDVPATPQTTLVILLGASKWPGWPDLDSEAFANSAREVRSYFLDPMRFRLPQENLLDLFGSDQSADEIDDAIDQFLTTCITQMQVANQAARDVLVYFIGHASFTEGISDYYLAIGRTRKRNPEASGLRIETFAKTVKENTRHLRCMLILDCCYAAAAFNAFQSQGGGLEEAVRIQTLTAFREPSSRFSTQHLGLPRKGTVLLCSSSRSKPSLLGKHYTEFSGAMLHVLNIGFKDELKYMSLDMVADLVREFLDETGSEAPRPEVHSPNQREGDVATIPFFPNPWAERQAEGERLRMEEEEERLHKAEEERLRKLKLLETTITNKSDKPDVMALIRQQFADSDVLALGQPTSNTSIAGTGTASDSFPFTVDDLFGVKQKTIPVFTQVNMANMMREALLRNPEGQSLKVFWVNGKVLLERLKQDVTIIINPESSLEFRLPITQKQVHKAEQEQPPKEEQVRKTANHLQSRRTEGITSPGQLSLLQQQHRPAVQLPVLPSNKPFTSFVVCSLAFFLLTGLGSMVDFLTHSTQYLHWAVGTVALATPLAYILAVGTVALAAPLAYILGYRKAMNFLTMTILALMSAAAVFGLTAYCSQLDFDYQRTSQLWFNLTRILWLGKQANFGLILGSISGGFAILVALDERKPQDNDVPFLWMVLFGGFILILIGWLVLAILALIFQWGFGFGYGWDTSLIAAGVGFVAASGFIGSFFFCIGVSLLKLSNHW